MDHILLFIHFIPMQKIIGQFGCSFIPLIRPNMDHILFRRGSVQLSTPQSSNHQDIGNPNHSPDPTYRFLFPYIPRVRYFKMYRKGTDLNRFVSPEKDVFPVNFFGFAEFSKVISAIAV